MHILFAISVFAFCALLWASLSIARHLRVGSRQSNASSEGDVRQPKPATREPAGNARAQQAGTATRKAA